MDRRQQKTRAAIFGAFSVLLSKENYNKITVQEIIDQANIGRTTFYTHFETKDDLLKTMCEELFDHVINGAMVIDHPEAVFCHLLKHLEANQNLLTLLSSENNEIFLRYFKKSLNQLMKQQFSLKDSKLPEDFLINHISSSFVEMVIWWIDTKQRQSAEELDYYFHYIIDPIIK